MLATYMRRMRSKNLEIRIVGSFCRRNNFLAVRTIIALFSFVSQEDLTALGKYLAYLPVEPRIAKMIIYGAIFRCLDPILTIAAGLSYKDPFVTPLNCRLQADQVP